MEPALYFTADNTPQKRSVGLLHKILLTVFQLSNKLPLFLHFSPLVVNRTMWLGSRR